MENKLAHLQMIQGVIDRLAGNSFLVKGWSVTLVSAMFALAAADARSGFVLLAYFPAVLFWGLDGYFLYQERAFRSLYDEVRVKREDHIDFAMLIPTASRGAGRWGKATFSATVLGFHAAVLGSILFVMFAVLNK